MSISSIGTLKPNFSAQCEGKCVYAHPVTDSVGLRVAVLSRPYYPLKPHACVSIRSGGLYLYSGLFPRYLSLDW